MSVTPQPELEPVDVESAELDPAELGVVVVDAAESVPVEPEPEPEPESEARESEAVDSDSDSESAESAPAEAAATDLAPGETEPLADATVREPRYFDEADLAAAGVEEIDVEGGDLADLEALWAEAGAEAYAPQPQTLTRHASAGIPGVSLVPQRRVKLPAWAWVAIGVVVGVAARALPVRRRPRRRSTFISA
ncbi:hypothetical protein [Agromyces seonyuensis]|uniref:Uncharacterized protein n=1 Tax=Agromyces seonyuensis TaxID=2662446 RepID=A0A6I4P4T1_9MICO|nr:hypothetical protein [Agromyces seonyuensis]MWB99359.1 hypothetical protein [Agromyces seonyuensis]